MAILRYMHGLAFCQIENAGMCLNGHFPNYNSSTSFPHKGIINGENEWEQIVETIAAKWSTDGVNGSKVV